MLDKLMGSSAKAVISALGRSLAIIEFEPTGKIISANANFCAAMGYSLSEIKGRHHSMFVAPDHANSADYKAFWARLGRGEFDTREFQRIGKNGKEIWIQASYSPLLNARGDVSRIVKVATDITDQKRRALESQSKLDAISRVQAVIEFSVTGEILTANENFLSTMGYSLSEIQGLHHSMFVDAAYAQSEEYQDFWRKLSRGEFVAAEFRRLGKGGREVWIQASYNPIFDMNGKVAKIVKFATDVSERVRAVNDIAAGLEQLSENNLTHRIDRAFDPAFERLRTDYNSVADRLHGAMSSIAVSATQVASGSEEIASASDDLSRRTEHQAASLEETAAALAQITTTVKRSADGAAQAALSSAAARVDADRSGEIVREAVAAMGEIEQSSSKISRIIGVIDEIAFQTNLLALNAGVEAARAGDAGRGFAVVAQEVRALAQRSAEAAKEIKGLISSSTTQVARGVKLVGDTGQTLVGISNRVAEIDELLTEIARSSQEQATGLNQVNAAVDQMDHVTQQNAAMVEEATAAAAGMSSEAAQLTQLVGQFQLGDNRVTRRLEPARPGRHPPGRNPVVAQRARLSTAVGASWSEF